MRGIFLPILFVFGMTMIIPNVFASHSSDPDACYGEGLYDGKNNPFSSEFYDMCGDPYYEGFIDGCMSVDNSRDVCESATDE